MNLHIQRPLRNNLKQLRRILLLLLLGRDILPQRRATHLNILRAQPGDRKRRHRPRRAPETHQRPLARDRLHAPLERVLAHAVKDPRDARAARELLHLRNDVLVAVVDHELRTVRLRQRDLLVRARSADRARANGVQQLAEPQAHAAGGGVDEDPVALLHVVGLADEGKGGEALEDGGGGDAGLDA